MYTDATGEIIFSTIFAFVGFAILSSVVAGSISGLGSMISAAAMGQDIGAAFVGGFVNGAISTLGVTFGLACGPFGVFVAAGVGFVGGLLGSATSQQLSTGSVDWKIAAINGGISAGFNMVSFGLTSWIAAGIADDVAGGFLSRLCQAFQPDLGMLTMSMMTGGMIGFAEHTGRILSHYITGGKYGEKSILKFLYV